MYLSLGGIKIKKTRKIILIILPMLVLLSTLLYFSKNKYVTVKIISNIDDRHEVIKIRKGDKITEPAQPEKSGYIFVEWQSKNLKFDFDKVVKTNITITAKWIRYYTVNFISNNGTELSEVLLYEGELLSEPDKLYKEGYIFVEWHLNGVKFDFSSQVTDDMVLEAIWVESFTVIFDYKLGSSMEYLVVGAGEQVIEPEIPTYEGYDFIEWQLNEVKYDFNTPVQSNIQLTAKWIKYFKINFVTNNDYKLDELKVSE